MLTRTTLSIATLAVAATLVTTVGAQSTTRVSVSSSGAEANGPSYLPSMSADGRFVVFGSSATNLYPAAASPGQHVYIHDRQAGTTEPVDYTYNGPLSQGSAVECVVSADGNIVVFQSNAADLVPNDVNGFDDIFVRDRSAFTTRRVSVSSSGVEANSWSESPTVSANGSFVAFSTRASNLVQQDNNGHSDVFRHDLVSGTTICVSVNNGGSTGDQDSVAPSMSGDGRYVAFQSTADDLLLGDTNNSIDVFVRDCLLGVTTRASLTSTGQQVTGGGASPVISPDGRWVAFASSASTLVAGDTNGWTDVFRRDTFNGTTDRVSVGSGGYQADFGGWGGVPSPDGRFVAFGSSATDLAGCGPWSHAQVYVHDTSSGLTRLLSIDLIGGCGQLSSGDRIAMSADGRYIAFDSRTPNLVPGDTNQVMDVVVRDWWSACFSDADSDGFGAGAPTYSPPPACGAGYSSNQLDCDDTNSAVHPGVADICNGIDDDCDGVVDNALIAAYCTAGTTVHGCLPWMAGEGDPSSTAATGFDVVVHAVEGQRMGLIYYGFYPAAVPWAVGSPSYRCVSFPVQRTGAVNSGGTFGHCDGELRVDFNAWMQANPQGLGYPFLQGQVFYAQGWFRDSGAPKGTNLSDGLRFTLCN